MSPSFWPSWWPRAQGEPTEAPPPAATPATGPAPEPEETAFQNWSRRLIIGHRDIVRQVLADAAAQEREEQRTTREDIRAASQERRARENILLNIHEQAKVNQEREAREAAERGQLGQYLVNLRQGSPSGEPSEPLPPEGLFKFKGGREAYQAEYPKPTPPPPRVFQDKQGNIRDYRTAKIIEPAPVREKFTPPEGYVPSYIVTPEGEIRTHYTLPPMPYGLDAIAQQFVNPSTGKAYNRYAELPPNLKEQAQTRAEKLQGTFSGSRESGRYASEVTQAIGDKAGEYIHPETYTTPHPDLPRATVWRDYRHVPRAAGAGGIRSLGTVRETLEKLTDVVLRRGDLYPPEGLVNVQTARRVTWPLANARGDPDAAILGSLVIAMPTFARSFGDTGNIAVVERIITQEAAGLQGDSRAGGLNRVKTILDLVNSRLKSEGLNPFKIDALDRALDKQKKPVPKTVTVEGQTGRVLD